MQTRTNGIRQAIRTVVLLVSASAAVFANQAIPSFSGSNIPLCYCHCAHESGMKHCTKMCDLPQYEKRWWANSCHKKTAAEKQSAAPASNSGSKKTNRKEQASL
jgi:hypothetical protein